MKSVLTVIGTRPEVIKLAPVLMAINNDNRFENKVCITRQHTDLLAPFLLSLGISIDYNFETCEKQSNLHQNAACILKQFSLVLSTSRPDLVLVQGDTTTAFIATLAAFYALIPVAHIEAGLRTGNLHSPWPEEAHRCLIDRLSTYFFAPTIHARNTLLKEGAPSEKIWVVGNTSIDALKLIHEPSKLRKNKKKRSVIVTIHRRENQGEPLREICQAIRIIAEEFFDVRIVFFLHPNPAVREPVIDMLSGIHNIDLTEPLDHLSFIRLLDECTFAITDSGGIQEETSFIGKPLLIVRDTTERPEGIQAGTAWLVGTKSANITACCRELLSNTEKLASMSKVHFPYGDGHAARRIVNILASELEKDLR